MTDPNKNTEPKTKEDFSDEAEFRSFVADKAVALAKEHNMSLKEATQQVIKEFTNKEGVEV